MTENFQRIYKTGNDANLVDGSGDEVGTSNNRFEVESRDTDTYTIFNNILLEMKKMNLHLSLITDTLIINADVEV